MEETLCYDMTIQQYSKSQEVMPDKKCNCWTAVNAGDTNVYVNGFLLKPYPPGHPELTGAALGVPGEKGEYYKGRISIVFETGGTAPLVYIVQKFYKP